MQFLIFAHSLKHNIVNNRHEFDKLQELMMDREAWRAARVAESRT